MRRRGFMIASMSAPFVARAATTQPVVLELFTSQGCSSCPPADALLGEMTRRPGVIGLAWHVDYWNSLGWRDPYARPEWTTRQRDYARYLDGEVYTPALVVNGATLMVGSDRAAVDQAINRAAPPAVAVSLRRSATGLTAEIGATGVSVTGRLISYDPSQVTRIGAGENGGRQLTEYRVVRDAVVLTTLASRMELPPVAAGRGAVLLLQDASWRVVGAAEIAPG